MADTKISALDALAGTSVAATDEIVIVDKSDTAMAASGTNKRVVASGLLDAAATAGTLGVTLTLADAVDIVVNATTGTKIGTATSQKLGFFNATPVVQQVDTTDLGVALSNLGLRAAGTAYPITTSGAVGLSGTNSITGATTFSTANVTITDVDVILSATTGTKIGTATTQKLGFFNATPVVQPSAYTQTYSTADKTHANPTAASLTVADGAGTPDGTIAAIATGGASADQASVIEAVQELADQINKIVVDHADTKALVNSVIDDLQALGLVG